MASNCACSTIAQQVAALAVAMGSSAAFQAARVIAERIDSGLGPFTEAEVELMAKMIGADSEGLVNRVFAGACTTYEIDRSAEHEQRLLSSQCE